MFARSKLFVWFLASAGPLLVSHQLALADVKAWEGTITIPTYSWEEDINPKFWALEGPSSLSTTLTGAITYPYTMQDDLSRTKTDRTYKALFLENEYLKVSCLPELGGRLHAVLDKTKGEDMFHRNQVIKPGMIAMRGAWISGGVEWNSGPHGHTVTIVSPVDAVIGKTPDGSAFLEVNNQEKIFRTRWTVRVTLRPGRKYLEESVRIFNPTDGMHPYYFWNCTAFPNNPGTRFIYPMTLGTDHDGREFFGWPIHEGKDVTWLKNYITYASVFAVNCEYDFFGAYDVDADRGIVQIANHRVLPGKKAWTWGTWDFGLVSQQSLTDEDGPYIEVQSGPLPTQSDYGMLAPREQVAWQEWWYPVHGLGNGFEFATKDVAVQTDREDGSLSLRLIATGEFPGATCTLQVAGGDPARHKIDLSPMQACTVALSDAGQKPVRVAISTKDGRTLARFTTPLPIPKVTPPDPSKFAEKEDSELSVEEKYFKGRKFDRATSRLKAREYYQKAVADDPRHVLSLRALAVLDLEAGLYEEAIERLKEALDRDGDDGLAWYFLGVCHLARGETKQAVDCGYRATRPGSKPAIGYDLAGRALMRMGRYGLALREFQHASEADPKDIVVRDHRLLALYALERRQEAFRQAEQVMSRNPTDLVPRALRALKSDQALAKFAMEARDFVGEDDFEMIETALTFADLGLHQEAERVLKAVCVDAVPEADCCPLPLYYLALFVSRQDDDQRARKYLARAAQTYRDFEFPSRTEALEVLRYAIEQNPEDAGAHLYLGNLLGGLGRMNEALAEWRKAVELDASLSVAFRNLGLATWALQQETTKAIDYYQKAIAARPDDQTLYRDMAEILIADERRPEAIAFLEAMPKQKARRSDITIMLAQAYSDEGRYSDTIDLLESTPYFVNWEGQDITWVLFHQAHVQRGQERFKKAEFQGALTDFQAALTYPENLGVGRKDKPQEATAEYWLGTTLEALDRPEEAREAFQRGASGCKGSDEQNTHRKLCRESLEAEQ